MGLATAEGFPAPGSEEVYARSLRALRALGECAYRGATEQYEAARATAYGDFYTATLENLGTDKELRLLLDIERVAEHPYVDGHAMAANGETMADLVRRGLDTSRRAAQEDPRMLLQAERDKGDVVVADVVDRLLPGQVLVAVSMCPSEALAGPDRKFWEGYGYMKGLVFVQVYERREHAPTIIARSFSVNGSDPTRWADVLAKYGLTIAADTPSSQWIQHHHIRQASPEEAEGLAGRIRDDYYKLAGVAHRRYSVTEYGALHESTIQRYFSEYIVPLASAIDRDHDAPIKLLDFAQRVLDSSAIQGFPPAVRQELMGVVMRRRISASAGPIMEQLVRYSLAEELRGGLVYGIGQDNIGAAPKRTLPIDLEALQQRIVGNISNGVAAGHSYGGCASLPVTMQKGADSSEGGINGPQSAYGGKDSDETLSIPAVIRCIKCDKLSPRRVVVQKDSWRCPHCKYQIDICTGVEIHASEPELPATDWTEQFTVLWNGKRRSADQSGSNLLRLVQAA